MPWPCPFLLSYPHKRVLAWAARNDQMVIAGVGGGGGGGAGGANRIDRLSYRFTVASR